MRALNSDEKSSTVIVYTASMLIRGDIILRDSIRVSIWPRTQGVPNFIHLFNVQIIQIAGSVPKNFTRDEVFVPTPEVIGFHLAPPAHDPLDYDEAEANRRIQPIQIMAGTFEVKANLRVSTVTDFAASLDVLNASWMSLYDAEITNPFLPQLHLNVPMLLLRSNAILIGL